MAPSGKLCVLVAVTGFGWHTSAATNGRLSLDEPELADAVKELLGVVSVAAA